MKTHCNRRNKRPAKSGWNGWKRYEEAKAEARRVCRTPEEYETYIRDAAKKLGL